MDIGTNSNGNSIQVRNQVGDLTVLIGSDPFLPQPESPTVEPEFDAVDENLNTPPLPSPSVTPEYETENLAKSLHPYLKASICLDTESKQILETPTSPLDENPPLTELKPVDPEIFASPPPRKRKRRSNSPATSNPPEKPTTNILYHRPPTPIPMFVQPPPQEDDSPVRPLLLVQLVHIPAGKGAKSPPSLLQLIVSPTPDLLYKLKTSRRNSLQTIKNLASTLAFNEEAQVMAIKSNMPRDIYGLCMQYQKLDELKKFLIELFENPRMKSAMPSITTEVETSAFSIGEFVNNDVVLAMSDDIGKLKNEISALQFKVRRMLPTDSRNKPTPKPWKPEVTPPRRKGNAFRGRSFRQNDMGRRDNSNSGQNSNNSRDRNFDNRNQLGNNNGNRKPFGNRGQNNGNFGGNQRGRGRGRGRFDTSPNVRRPRVASKPVNKDKGRCFYCNEFGHFAKECSKKIEDERNRRYSRMDTDYHQDGQYSDYDDTGLFTDDYDDKVFATLNS